MPSLKVSVYSKDACPFCVGVKRLLNEKKVSFEEINVGQDPEKMNEIIKKTGHPTVPQVFINEQFVGGYQELQALDATGELDRLLGI